MERIEQYNGRVIVVGDARTGKSSLIKRYFNQDFNEDENSTIGVDFFMKESMIDKYVFKVQVWDTAGQERFLSIINHFFRDTTVAILVYDVTERESFKNVEHWLNCINDVDKPGILYVIGNKIDLHNYRKVEYDEGDALAKRLNARFFETSAKSNAEQCVNRMFDAIIADIYNIVKYNPDKLEQYHIHKAINPSRNRGMGTITQAAKNKCCVIC